MYFISVQAAAGFLDWLKTVHGSTYNVGAFDTVPFGRGPMDQLSFLDLAIVSRTHVASHSIAQVRLAKLNTEAEPDVAARFGIRSIPTLIAFRGGREVARQSGAMDLPGLLRWVKTSV